ncbi:MAG: hypothetical protein LBB67_03330 [Oscillospiraceae bacterium]|nr:hypothetical protein [Oscillospiraceae bacterium]
MSATVEYKCPNCGGAISFDSASQKMSCPYCDTEFEIENLRQYNEAHQNGAQPTQQEWNYSANDWNDGSLRGFICPSCAGELIGDATTAATRCPYCGNPAVLPSQLSGVYKPDFVIPFKLDKESAKKAFLSNMRGKKLLPKCFRTDAALGEITGIYVPFWLFDCDVQADINYRATKTHTWSDSKYHHTRTDHFSLVRGGTIRFAHIPADGSKKMDDTFMEAIEPYDYRDMRPFRHEYLAGYLADKYDVTAPELRDRVNQRITATSEQLFRASTNAYGGVRTENARVAWTNGKVYFALLPVWTLNATYGGKPYHYAMNGQTGKFVGKFPISYARATAWIAGTFAAVMAIFAVLSFFI